MHRLFCALFLVILCLYGVSGKVVHAQTLKNTIVTNDMDEPVLIGQSMYITKDEAGELNVQDIVQRFRNNIRGQRNTSDYVQLPFQVNPHWIAFEIYNDTEDTQFFLDFGSLVSGKSGTINKLLVYEGYNRKIILDGLTSVQDEEQNAQGANNIIEIDIDPMASALYVLYVVPDDSYPLILKPTFHKDRPVDGTIDQFFQSTNLFPVLFAVILAFILIGFLYNQALGFAPLLLFYVLGLFRFYYIDINLFAEFTGAATLGSILVLINGLLVLLACYLTIPAKKGITNMRAVVFFTIGLNIIGLILISIMVPPGVIIRPYCAYGLAFMSIVVGLLFLIFNLNHRNKGPVLYLTGWAAFYGVALALKVMAGFGILPPYSIFTNADYFVLIPHVVFIMLGVIAVLQADTQRQISEVIRKAQKAQTLLKAKQSKEASDQSRLLRVIEREREIMEELRGREAERTEEMRRAKESADEANNAKSAFLAVVSHEIRTPMTGIMGMMRLMEGTDLSEEQRDYTNTIKDSADAMLALLNDILDFSKIEGGGMELETIDFELKRVLKGVLMLMRGHADQKDIPLLLEIDDNVPNYIQGDPTRLRQIFLNLIGNALKFTESGHVKIIATLNHDVHGHDPQNGIHAIYFAVEDTGIGISEDAQKKLFSPFSQADSTIARKYGGTGLGLAICRRLVEAMGGKIEIFSKESKGSRFYFTLLMRQSGQSKDSYSSPAITHEQPEHTCKVLVVDDNAINRKVVGGLLARDKHTVSFAESGAQALELLQDENGDSYDCVLLDIELPDIKGTEIAKIIREDMGNTKIHLIALTGNVAATDIESYNAVGMNGHLAKPIDPEALKKILNEMPCESANDSENSSNVKHQQNPSAALPENSDEQSFVENERDEKANKAPTNGHVTQLLDEQMLKGLRDGLGTEQTRELIIGLFEKSEEIIQNMLVAYDKEDAETLTDRAHELKGMAANFGLKGLSDKAAVIEKICGSEEPALVEIKDYIEILESVNERSKKAVDDYLSNSR